MFRQIEFLNPEFLYLLFMIPLLLAWEIFRHKKRNSSLLWSSSHMIQKNLNWKLVLKYVLQATRLLAFSAIIIALARPQKTEVSTETLSKEGIDIVLAMDVSTSTHGHPWMPKGVRDIH